jgi:hypothetical protein
MFKLIFMTITLLFCILFANCATIFSGSTQMVTLESSPPDAEVYINGNFFGKTPLSTPLPKDASHSVLIRKYGYYDSNLYIGKSVAQFWLILDILGGLPFVFFVPTPTDLNGGPQGLTVKLALGLIPLAIDALVGNWKKLNPTYLHSDLQRWR